MADHNIDTARSVYLFLHGRADLRDKATAALTNAGFSASRIEVAVPTKVGEVGDYMAMLWMPPNPDHVKIQKITGIEPVEAEGMIGLWKGAKKDDLFTIPL